MAKAKVLSNLESVGDMIGALKGIEEGLEEDNYIAGVIRSAHGDAANLFDVMTASVGATGHLEHVFEYDAKGGPSLSPAPASRLWTHTIVGRGGNQDIGFLFRPANNPNPQPTTESTGVPSKYLARLSKRKYVFWNRALVMETGQTVTIKPKNGQYLFVPFYGKASRQVGRNGRLLGVNRGYKMDRGPITATPGGRHRGRFVAHWMAWWGGEGQEFMEQHMRGTVGRDIETAEAHVARNAALKPVQSTNLESAKRKGFTRLKKVFGAATKTQRNKRTI